MPNLPALAKVRLAAPHVEIRVRRLRWLLQCLKHHTRFAQFPVVFGRSRDDETTEIDRCASDDERAIPWCEQRLLNLWSGGGNVREELVHTIKQHERAQEEIEKGGPRRCTALMGDGETQSNVPNKKADDQGGKQVPASGPLAMNNSVIYYVDKGRTGGITPQPNRTNAQPVTTIIMS
eukprot:1133743-Pyramimonas_sp.AAC.1